MNRKQLRRERRIKNKAGRERHRARIERNRLIWCNEAGDPVLVMDDPSEDHAKALLLRWLTPRALLSNLNEEVMAKAMAKVNERMDSVILKTLCPELETIQFPNNLWRTLVQMSGIVVEAPPLKPTIKVW